MSRSKWSVVSLGQRSHSLGQGLVLLCGPSTWLRERVGSSAWCHSPSHLLVGLAELCAVSSGLDVGTEHWEASQVEGYELLA